MKDLNKNSYTVYMHVCPSEKRYIGITKREPQKRWGNGANYKNNKHFYSAIKKYGWENIRHEILFENMTKEKACEKEKELISLYKTNEAKYGYNLTDGGEHYEFSKEVINKLCKPKRLSEETREQMRERGKRNYEKNLRGKPLTQEQIKKMADAKRGKKQDETVVRKRAASIKAHYEKTGGHTDETKKKISVALSGRTYSPETIEKMKSAKSPQNNPRSRAVKQIENGIVVAQFCSAREAERQTGINYTSIVRVCNGVRLKSAGGFVWSYA